MRATEFRIGNLVFIKGQPREVNTKDLNNLLRRDITYLSPISITEEWLDSLGFEVAVLKNRSRAYFEDRTDFNINLFTNGEVKVSYKGNYLPHINHVHQLQNLYHALTGEELKPSQKYG